MKLRIIIALLCLLASSAMAADKKEIESITVLADSSLAVPLSQAASAFAHKTMDNNTMISVANIFGVSANQKKKIEDGDSGDVFITTDASLIQQLKTKGMIDVYSIGEIASEHARHYTAAVVASENMTPARKFLEYLKSDEAKEIFDSNGFTTPE